MSSLYRRPRSPAVKTPLEDDDLLGEILLRLPPQPSSLPRASVVCKRWRSLASDPGFFRRFRRHHRCIPPLLGLFQRGDLSFIPTLEAPNRVPPGRFSLEPGDSDGDRFMSLGCRDGLVLISNIKSNQMTVWDPVTGDQHRLAIPPRIATHAEKTAINGGVLCVGGDAHFQVVLAVYGNDDEQHERVLACAYLSEAGLWGDLISIRLPSDVPESSSPTLVFTGKPPVMAGGSLYWILAGNFDGILEFDLEKQILGVIQVPVHMLKDGHYLFWIMRVESGGLGLLFQTAGRSFQLWKRKTDGDGFDSWVLGKTIELEKLLSLNLHLRGVIILGFAENNNVVFFWTSGNIFMVHVESLQFKKLFETNFIPDCHPFESFYTAGVGGGHDGVDLFHNT